MFRILQRILITYSYCLVLLSMGGNLVYLFGHFTPTPSRPTLLFANTLLLVGALGIITSRTLHALSRELKRPEQPAVDSQT